MKKLMILAAVAMAVFASNAAICKWTSASMKKVNGTTALGAGATGYLFELSSTEYTALQNKFALTDGSGKALSDLILKEYGSKITEDTITATSAGNSQINFTSTAKQETVAIGPHDFYAALLYTYTDTSTDPDTVYWMGNLATGHLEDGSSTSPQVSNLGLKIGGSGAATAWTTAAIPEPTSGLLLLLGMAGLALRRRRA